LKFETFSKFGLLTTGFCSEFSVASGFYGLSISPKTGSFLTLFKAFLFLLPPTGALFLIPTLSNFLLSLFASSGISSRGGLTSEA